MSSYTSSRPASFNISWAMPGYVFTLTSVYPARRNSSAAAFSRRFPPMQGSFAPEKNATGIYRWGAVAAGVLAQIISCISASYPLA